MDITVLLVGVGVVLIGILLTLLYIQSAKACSSLTEGTVTGHRMHRSSARAKYYYENVTYYVGNTKYKHKRKAGFQTPQYQVGEKLPLYFDPANPKKSKLEVDKKDKPILGPFIVLFGISIIVFAFFIW